jgi:hypothetical protein
MGFPCFVPFHSVARCGFIVGYSVVYVSLGVDVFGTVHTDTGFSSIDAEIRTREFSLPVGVRILCFLYAIRCMMVLFDARFLSLE